MLNALMVADNDQALLKVDFRLQAHQLLSEGSQVGSNVMVSILVSGTCSRLEIISSSSTL